MIKGNVQLLLLPSQSIAFALHTHRIERTWETIRGVLINRLEVKAAIEKVGLNENVEKD